MIGQPLSEEQLSLYVPDVYQKDIYAIDYGILRDAGITLLTFDVDDTLDDGVINKIEANVPGMRVRMPERARDLVKSLRDMGFGVVILTNAQESLGRGACQSVGADGYLARAGKPGTDGFAKVATRYGITPCQLAHIGNSMREDVAGGNRFGATTCLVRQVGPTVGILKAIARPFGIRTKGQRIREQLLARDMWRKHHLRDAGDQYYQLGSEPLYRHST